MKNISLTDATRRPLSDIIDQQVTFEFREDAFFKGFNQCYSLVNGIVRSIKDYGIE